MIQTELNLLLHNQLICSSIERGNALLLLEELPELIDPSEVGEFGHVKVDLSYDKLKIMTCKIGNLDWLPLN